jgi:hypothetical protein
MNPPGRLLPTTSYVRNSPAMLLPLSMTEGMSQQHREVEVLYII